jgi:hypothetical protein
VSVIRNTCLRDIYPIFFKDREGIEHEIAWARWKEEA